MDAKLALLLALSAMLAGCAGPSEMADGVTTVSSAPGVYVEATTVDGPAAVPHVHDYWSGRERVTLVDAELTVEPPTAVVWGVMTTRFLGETSFGGAFLEFPEGALVYEGAGRMEITVTWSDPGITGMRFLHRHAGSGDIQPWTETPNGETAVLELAPEMTDMPHAQSSRWVLLFAASGTPAVAIGTFHVQVDIVKTREIAEWPAHPNLWKGRSEVLLADGEGGSAARVAATELLERDPWAEPEDAIPSQALVPMEAATVRVVVRVLNVDSPVEVEGLHLLVRSASDVVFDFDSVGDPADVSADRLTWTWEIPVEMDQTDSPYADASAWAFRVVAGSLEADLPPCDHGCYEADLRYHLIAVAAKAPTET